MNIFNMRNYQEPEEDVDDVAHPSYDRLKKTAEQLIDHLRLMGEKEVSVDLQPEKDMDELFQDNNRQAVPCLRPGEVLFLLMCHPANQK